MRPIAKALVIIGATVWMPACHEPTGPDPTNFLPHWALELGHIMVGRPPFSPTAPDSAAAGAAFVVSLWTSNSEGPCFLYRGNTQIAMPDSSTVEIRPYDKVLVNPPGGACDLVGRSVQYLTAVRFGQPGIATVRLIGRSGDSTVTITRTVVIH